MPTMLVTVAGFKSLRDKHTVEIRPLTILAGANSSGKSSLLQPLLLLKQTLEAPFDPGPLLLNGPNAKFTSSEQILSLTGRNKRLDSFEIGVRLGLELTHDVTLCFRQHPGEPLDLAEMRWGPFGTVSQHMAGDKLHRVIRNQYAEGKGMTPIVVRNRCFLEVGWRPKEETTAGVEFRVTFAGFLERNLLSMIHLPGHRGNPKRSYPAAAISPRFPGTFDNYTASVIEHLQAKEASTLEAVGDDLQRLGLTWKVQAQMIDQTQLELQVGRLSRPAKGGSADLVSIADVGFGVSQVLPVIAALRIAVSEQLVYIEQPELHLHPRAQWEMAGILADAARRGVRVVAETHSSTLLRGVQTLVAEGKLDPALIKLYWFQRRQDGFTDIRSAELDDAGAFGDWPEDFDKLSLEMESRYIDAAEARLRAAARNGQK